MAVEVHEVIYFSSPRKKKPAKEKTPAFNVWDSPRVKAILERPEGTPIDLSTLTDGERDALPREAKGMWAGHPDIKNSVEWVRGLRQGLSRRLSWNT